MAILNKRSMLQNHVAGLISKVDEAGGGLAGALAASQESLEVASKLEAARIAAKYGPDSERAKEAAALVERHAAETRHAALAAARVSRKPPEPDKESLIVFGRVLDEEGESVSGARITAVGGRDVDARATSGKEGDFELRIPAGGKAHVKVASKDGKLQVESREVFEGLGGKIAYRDYVLPASRPGAAPRRKHG